MPKILVIEDEEVIRRVLKKILTEQDAAYDVYVAPNGIDGLHEIEKQQFDLVLCDIKMPKMDGIEVLQNIKIRQPDLPVIMLSGHGDLETAVETMRIGAFDYISKPPDLNRLMTTVGHALNRKTLEQENKVLKRKIGNAFEMIGQSPAIKEIKEIIEKVAATSARVLITGSNGTGKELVAHWIHQKSERAQGPLIEVNCAAIPSELIESELFGHVKGAFTSAIKDRAGKFEAAHGGTLFLDEIGDMSLSAQAKVLRALQENLIQRVGGDKSIKIDVRIIAATNKNLKEEIALGRFREDLFHRIAVILIQVPPLNDRREDIPLLINYFVEQISATQAMQKKTFSAEAIDCLKNYDWTGNIRELRNVVERLLILGGAEISKKDVLQFANKL